MCRGAVHKYEEQLSEAKAKAKAEAKAKEAKEALEQATAAGSAATQQPGE